jgi:integrase
MLKAQGIAADIYRDILQGNFDPTLVKYAPHKLKGRSVADAVADFKEALGVSDFSDASRKLLISDLFKEYTAFKKQSLKANSMIDYDRISNKLKLCPYKKLSETVQIIQWMVEQHQGKNPNTLSKYFKILKAMGDWCVISERIDKNYFQGLNKLLPKVKHNVSQEKIEPFTSRERDEIIRAFYVHKHYCYYAPLVQFLFFSGCRPEEALALQWKHIKGERVTFSQVVTHEGKIEVGLKTQQKRSITLSTNMINALPLRQGDDVLVFRSSTGKLIDWHNFANRAWRKVLESLPHIEYRNPYQMRHTAITELIKTGIDSVIVAKWVGNSPGIIAKHYMGDVSKISIPQT